MKVNNNFLVVLIGLLGILLPTISSAQTKTSNNDVWFHYVGKNMVTKKLSFTFSTQKNDLIVAQVAIVVIMYKLCYLLVM